MTPSIKPGVRLEAKDTQTNRSCGIAPGAPGRVVFVDTSAVSVYLERGTPGAGWIEARCDAETIGSNFRVFEHDIAPGYLARGHYGRAFPGDFVR